MCAAANLTAFAYWPAVEPHVSDTAIQNYSATSFMPDSSKNKFLRQSMFFFNSIPKQEFFPVHDKTRDTESKQFLTSLIAAPLSEESIPKKEDIVSTSLQKDSTEKARPYFCDECGKSFLLKHHLTTHARTHTGIRPHICTHCGKSFTHKHCLNTHLLLHSSERPFQCMECKKSFTLKHHLITHSKV